MSVMLSTICALVAMSQQVEASMGDRSWKFNRCLTNCLSYVRKCQTNNNTVPHHPFYMKLLQWTCEDECKYDCMWQTVEAFRLDSSPIPQFYGKWPFIRILGIQEPLSVLASLLNASAVIVMVIRLYKTVPSTAPMYRTWMVYSVIVIHAWIWSAIFHSRDTNLTEKMDYFCALSLVLSSVNCCILRIIGTENWKKIVAVTAVVLTFYSSHVYYMGFIHFDYGYNMTVNVGCGLLNATMWICWCLRHRKQKPYVYKCLFTMFSVMALLSLELGDFPPLWWVADAHSLWHLGTAPIYFAWYSFIIDDCLDLEKERLEKLTKLPINGYSSQPDGLDENTREKKD